MTGSRQRYFVNLQPFLIDRYLVTNGNVFTSNYDYSIRGGGLIPGDLRGGMNHVELNSCDHIPSTGSVVCQLGRPVGF